MRVLGVDPSLLVTGYGVVESRGPSLRLLDGGIITPGRSAALGDRLAELQRGLEDVIDEFHPSVMVVEEVFSHARYPRTALLMAHARGALLCAAAQAGIAVHDLAATAVKLAVAGRGSATKAQVSAMVIHTLRMRAAPKKSDVTDALALAIAFVRRNGIH